MKPSFTAVYTKFEALLNQQYELTMLLSLTSKLLQVEISHYDWVGFYLMDRKNNILVLGPYTGAPTEHIHIPLGKGICGQVAESCQTMVIQDVTQQENYLACSMDVQSEIVVPIIKSGLFLGEIDIDSHAYAPFDSNDEQLLSAIAVKLGELF